MAKVKHVVLLKLRRDLKPETVQHMFAAIGALREKIPGLLDFSAGSYSSPEGLNRGYTHGLVMTFADARSRDVYLTHPEHEKVKDLVFPMLEGGLDGAVAFDWEELT